LKNKLFIVEGLPNLSIWGGIKGGQSEVVLSYVKPFAEPNKWNKPLNNEYWSSHT